MDNPKGCTECFCFGRTTSCRQAGLSWGQRRLPRPRTLYVNDTINEIAVRIGFVPGSIRWKNEKNVYRWANLGRKSFCLPSTEVWTWPTDSPRFLTPKVMSRYRHTCITIIPSIGCCPTPFLAIRFSSFSLYLSLFFLFYACKMKFHFEGRILRRIFKIYKLDGGWDTFEVDFSIPDSATAGER